MGLVGQLWRTLLVVPAGKHVSQLGIGQAGQDCFHCLQVCGLFLRGQTRQGQAKS